MNFTERERYLIRTGLRVQGSALLREAKSRRYTGPTFAHIRRELRETSRECFEFSHDVRLS